MSPELVVALIQISVLPGELVFEPVTLNHALIRVAWEWQLLQEAAMIVLEVVVRHCWDSSLERLLGLFLLHLVRLQFLMEPLEL
jgi:hypothetical protein